MCAAAPVRKERMENRQPAPATSPSAWLLLALVVALPLTNPPVRGQLIAADLLFLLLIVVMAMEVLTRRRRLRWLPGFGALIAFAAALAPSLLASSNLEASLFKYATEFYLIGLTAVTAWIVDSEKMMRRVLAAWLAGTAVVALVAVAALVAFATGWAPWLLTYSSYDFGSLPPGAYPRLSLTFVFANMACNYLTVSLGLLLCARLSGYVGRGTFILLLTGILIAALSTISPGLGGIALLGGLGFFAMRRRERPIAARLGLLAAIAAAALFLVALAVTPFPYPEAPFSMRLPGGIVLYPSVRFLVWSSALDQFVHHPLIGIGIGIDPVHVRYVNPSGALEQLTDAHNIFLSIAAQCGILGLVGLGAIIWMAARRAPWSTGGGLRRFLLGATFLDVFVYQGLGGSFEDTRHVWVLLGLAIAASRPELTHPDESNHRPAEPLPG
jgi:O-antigen ligase